MDKPRGIPIVISSPSGGGKTTIYNELAKRCPDLFYSVSATTRPKRANEVDGVQYHFLTEEEFHRRGEGDGFIETALVHGYRYGTPKEPLEKALAEGCDAVLDVDIQGGDSVRRLFPDAVLIFIVPPDLATLRDRLENRRSEKPDHLEIRMINALDELRRAREYDYIVVNDEITRAVDEVEAVITAEHCRSARLAGFLRERYPELGRDQGATVKTIAMGIDEYINESGGDFSQWTVWIADGERKVLRDLGATADKYWTTLSFCSISEAREEFNRLVKAGCTPPPEHEVREQLDRLIQHGSQAGGFVVGVVRAKP